VSDTILHTH